MWIKGIFFFWEFCMGCENIFTLASRNASIMNMFSWLSYLNNMYVGSKLESAGFIYVWMSVPVWT